MFLTYEEYMAEQAAAVPLNTEQMLVCHYVKH